MKASITDTRKKYLLSNMKPGDPFLLTNKSGIFITCFASPIMPSVTSNRSVTVVKIFHEIESAPYENASENPIGAVMQFSPSTRVYPLGLSNPVEFELVNDS